MILVTWPRWPPCPYMVKTLQKSYSWADFHETWYVASGTPVYHSLYKWWPWSDLDLFYGKVKFGNLGFSIGKSENSGFSETKAASDLKVSRSRHLIEYMKICEYWRSRLFLDLGPRSCTYKKWNWIFSEITMPIWTNLLWKLSGTRKWKSDDIILITWPRWPPCPYMVKTSQKYFSPEPMGRIPRYLVCSIGDSSPS